MKKAFLFVVALSIALLSTFPTQTKAQTLSELREFVNTLNADCPTGNGDMDVLSVKMEDNNVIITFLLTENPKDDGFTIANLKKDKDGISTLVKLLLSYELLKQEETKDLITGCAMNNRNLQYCFLSMKSHKSHTITVTATELVEIIRDANSDEN